MDLDTFLAAYIECALWSTSDESTPEGGEPFDSNYSPEDLAPEALDSMRADCAAFIRDNAKDLEGMAPEQAGHDFWLTREGHGAGFWDRGLGERGERLSDAARAYGGNGLCLGDDGKIYAP